ncbi:60S acidic ribosomal protein P2-B-like [Phoca vitulina]|uniref:60S acidic ribosomal protein P2-B-like n=1 Tax=Phoca vitulina TaxID=9720 RepID=UPI001396314C|nr:60S acidic ribosomal protein P2-B-like [Phoca vitulina]
MVACARQKNGCPKMLTLMPGTCEYVTLHDQGDFADLIKMESKRFDLLDKLPSRILSFILVKAFLADPSAFVAAAPVAAAPTSAPAAAMAPAKVEAKEESEESDEDMGFGLFD